MSSSALARTAATVLALEGTALVVFALFEAFGLSSGTATSMPTAIALIVLTLVCAAALFAFAVGTLRGHSLSRSGGVVVQVLAIALVLVSTTVPPVSWVFVFGVGAPAVAGLVLLLAATRREASERTEGAQPGEQADS